MDPTEYSSDEEAYLDPAAHLLEVLTDGRSALMALWQVAEPLLRRSATRNLMQTASWSYWRVCDALDHSCAWTRAELLRASDGTRVLEESPPAVTNEVEATDGVEESEARRTVERGSRQERRAEHEDHGLGGIFVTSGSTLGRRETPEEAKARKAKTEAARLANLRKPRAKKGTRKR